MTFYNGGSPINPAWQNSAQFMTPNDETLEQMREQLHLLQEEHRDLDDAINRLSEGPYINELQLSRMKKRKLLLKDSIAKIETLLIPDLNA